MNRTGSHRADAKAKLTRLVNRAPEVMVKVTGRTRDGEHLRAHLNYISRQGVLEMDYSDGDALTGQPAIRDVAAAWSELAAGDRRTRAGGPIGLSVVLSMPRGADAVAVRDAARAWAAEVFADRFAYLLALHTDTGHPHVHVAVCARGGMGERLNPKKVHLEHWRQVFAQALRDRGVEAEATPRRARGVTRKPERMALRKIGERYRRGAGEIAQVRRSAYHEAARAALGRDERPVWEARTLSRQVHVRSLYLAQAKLLSRSPDPADRALAAKVEAFVRSMAPPDTQRLALARELRVRNLAPHEPPSGRGRERTR
ncbi:MAG TPA: relaxase/mobilization nuclease domain-containing protein [Caulobacteraceae bacterium]|nr:relaxase/mobilization nuclease domain-containing protein [Caulobacteraceae bacterium]